MPQAVSDLKKLGQRFLQFIQTKKPEDFGLIVRVESVIPLTKDQQSKLIKILSQKLKTKVTIENQVNKAIIGGIRIKYQDKLIDVSIKTKLDRLEESLLNE